MAAMRFRELMMLAGSTFGLVTNAVMGQPLRLTTPEGHALRVVAISSDGVSLLLPTDPADGRVFRFTPGVGFGANTGAGLQQVSIGGMSDWNDTYFNNGVIIGRCGKLSRGGREIAFAKHVPPFEHNIYRGYRATITPVNLPPLLPVPPVPAVELPGMYNALMISEDGQTVVGQRYSLEEPTGSMIYEDIVSISPQGAVTVLATRPNNGELHLRDISNDARTVLWSKYTSSQLAVCQEGAGYGNPTPPPPTIWTVTHGAVEVSRSGAVQVVHGAPLAGQNSLEAAVLSGDGRYAFVRGSSWALNTDICTNGHNETMVLTGVLTSKVDLTGVDDPLPLEVTSELPISVMEASVDGNITHGWLESVFRLYPEGTQPNMQWAENAISVTSTSRVWVGMGNAVVSTPFEGLWNVYRSGFPPTSPAHSYSESVMHTGPGKLNSIYFYLGIDPESGESLPNTTDGYQLYALVLDSDGDGLLDSWETPLAQGGGIDSDGDGVVDFDLYQRGARPGRKDLFIEIDSSPGVMPSDQAVQLVVAAFADAPVPNPDGTTGVTLHIERGESTLPPTVTSPSHAFPALFPEHKRTNFGTQTERGHNWEKVRNAKLLAYRYMAVYQTILTDELQPVGYSGRAELGGNDSVLVGSAFSSDEDAAALLMHELGHNLGLQHGGGDEVNNKPNHLSIMNYLFGFRTSYSQKFWRLDYARAGCETINESAVNESRGIRVDPEAPERGVYRFFRAPYLGGDELWHTTSVDGRATDFNTSGAIDASVAIDLTNFGQEHSQGQVLNSVNEWEIVKYRISESAILAEGPLPTSLSVPQSVDVHEETVEATRSFLNAHAPSPCYAEVGSQGGVSGPDELLDNNDFVVFVSAFFERDFETADMGIQGGLFGADDLLDNNDFISFINEFFSGGCN